MKINENKIVRRDEINLSLKLRGLFHTRHTSLKRQLQDTKVKMGDVVFLATQAYDQVSRARARTQVQVDYQISQLNSGFHFSVTS